MSKSFWIYFFPCLTGFLTGHRPYQPARAAWNQGEGRNSPRALSPLNIPNRPNGEMAGRNTPPVGQGDANNYYEDVDPRFAGVSAGPYQTPPVEPAYEDVHATNNGARSPAESERSNFTSISQRGVNPRWNPPPPMPQHYGGPPRRPAAQQRQDMILDNPDFQLPGSRPGGGAGRAPGMVPGSAYPTGPL